VGEHPMMAESVRKAMPVKLIECSDIASTVAFLCSDKGRYITGVALLIDAALSTDNVGFEFRDAYSISIE